MTKKKSAKSTKSSEIRTSRLVLEDSLGRDRIVMEMKDGQPDIAIIDEQRNVQIRIGIRTDNECPHVILAKGPGNPVILLSIDDSLAPIGSASIHLTGDYPGEGRKEIVLCNGEPLFEPSITLNSNGVTIAKLPTSKAKKSPKSAKSKRKSANVKAKK